MEEQQKNREHNRDPLAHFLFGPSRRNKDEYEHLPEKKEQPSLSELDLVEMMIHVDTLMESFSNLKPLFSKIQPLINMVWKSK